MRRPLKRMNMTAYKTYRWEGRRVRRAMFRALKRRHPELTREERAERVRAKLAPRDA